MSIVDMEGTGRRYPGPAEELLEILGSDGSLHTLVAYNELLRNHPRLAGSCERASRMHASSRIRGLVPFTLAGPGLLVYDTGPCWCAAEFIELMRHRGEPAGVRAGLELLGDGTRVLFAGSNVGARHGLMRHGAISPWRVFVSAQGDALILGYGIPDAGQLDQMRGELLRYTPPERMRKDPEGLPADIFCLALVAFEVITGEAFFGAWAQEQIDDADIRRRLSVLPTVAAEVFYGCLRIRPDHRSNGGAVLLNVQSALGDMSVSGPRLKQLAWELGQHHIQAPDLAEPDRTLPSRPQAVEAESIPVDPQERGPEPTVDLVEPDALLRAPDPVPPGPGGASRSTTIQLGQVGKRVTMELTARMSLAEAVSMIACTAVPAVRALDGRQTHAWRIGDRSGPLAGTLTLDRMPAGEVLYLWPVPARMRTLQIKVGREVRPITVSSVLQVSSLSYTLSREHTLPPSPWRLTLGDQLICPHLLVEELSENVQYELQPVW